MKWFYNLNVAKKMAGLIVLFAIFLAVVGYVGYRDLVEANDELEAMYQENLMPIQLIADNQTHLLGVINNLLELMLTTDDNQKKRLLGNVQQKAKGYNDNVALLEKIHLDDSQKKLMQEISVALQQYRNSRDEVIALAMENKNAEAYQLYVKAVAPLAETANGKMVELVEYTEENAKKTLEEDEKNVATSLKFLIGLIAGSLVVVAVLGRIITRIIANPLKQVATVANEVAGGNLAVGQIAIDSTDEVGQLASAINQMVNNLRDLIQKISNSTEQVAASSEQLNASSEQSAQASNQIAGAITDIAAGANEQLAAANETSAVVQQMSAGIQQVAVNANQVAAQSAQAADKANDGGQAVDKAVSQMNSIEQTVNTSAGVVAKLGERSKEIGQIVDTISGIAGQTNLLALNAAIEAARAGEQGRGFAVVAEEVRKLAEQSHEAAQQIAELIGEIQGDTDKAVEAMNNGTREVKTGAEVVNAAGGAFREIAGLVTKVSGQVKEISAAIQQMATGSEQIVGAVKKIDDLSKKSAGEAQGVSAATEEQLASMEEIASSSQALAKLAQDLQAAVTQFRV